MLNERAQRWLSVINTTNETIPAYAIMRITHSVFSQGEQAILAVGKPSRRSELSQDLGLHCFNGPIPIPPGKYGDATMDFPVRVLVDSNETLTSSAQYGLLQGKWHCTNRPERWRAMPALLALTNPDAANTVLANPTALRPPIPPLFVDFVLQSTLLTTYETMLLDDYSVRSAWYLTHAEGSDGNWDYRHLTEEENLERYGLRPLRPRRVGSIARQKYAVTLFTTVASPFLNPGDESEGAKKVTVSLFVNDQESEFSTTTESIYKTDYFFEGDLELSRDDLLDVRVKCDPAHNTGEILVRAALIFRLRDDDA